MFTFNMIDGPLRESCIRSQIRQEYDLTIKNIVLLYPDETASEEHTVYIGTQEILSAALSGWNRVSPRMIIVADAGDGMEQIAEYLREDALTSLCSTLPVPKIGNYLMSAMLRFQQRCDSIRHRIYQRQEISQVLKDMADWTKTPIFWLNSGYRLLASDIRHSFEDQYIQELIFQRYLSSSSVDALLKKSKKISLLLNGNLRAYRSRLDTGHCAILCEVRERHTFYGQFLLIYEDVSRTDALIDMSRVLASFFLQAVLLEKKEGGDSEDAGEGYVDLLTDLIEQKLVSRSELFGRVHRLNPPMTNWYRCMVIGFSADGTDANGLTARKKIAEAIPHGIVIPYEKDMVALLRLRDAEDMGYEEEKLEQTLSECGAWACLGMRSEYLLSFRMIFLHAQACLHLGLRLMKQPEQRIFSAEEYGIYYAIRLLAENSAEYQGRDLIYLCSPRYVALRCHDRDHGDNLCEIMEAYFEYNCNTSQTAKALYLHRNTLIHKLGRIEEIIGASLDDYRMRNFLAFSSMVMKYMEIFVGEI